MQEDGWQELAKKYVPTGQHSKKSRKGERKHQETIGQLPAPFVKRGSSKVAAEQLPLSHETSLRIRALAHVMLASPSTGMGA